MAKCAICEKAAHFGNNVSHSHRRSNKMWKSNVKSVKIKTAEGGARKTYVCTSCLRSGKVRKSINNTITPVATGVFLQKRLSLCSDILYRIFCLS